MSSTGSAQSSETASIAGITGGYDGDSFTLKVVIALFLGLSLYNAVELTTLLFVTFVRYKGVYFWSLLVATLGVIPYAVGFLLKFFEITNGLDKWMSLCFITIGWYAMVTGQSVVLWSRLHLILMGQYTAQILSWTKWMIIINVLILHVPTTVLTFGCNGSISVPMFVGVFNVYEKIQMVGFCIQEFLLSAIYIINTIGFLKSSLQPHTRKTMYQLITINVLIVVMDVALLGFEFANLYIIEASFKGVVYSVKLKLEFAVLGKLVQVASGNQSNPTRGGSVGFEPGKDLEDKFWEVTTRKKDMPVEELTDSGAVDRRVFQCRQDADMSSATSVPDISAAKSDGATSSSTPGNGLFEHYERIVGGDI